MAAVESRQSDTSIFITQARKIFGKVKSSKPGRKGDKDVAVQHEEGTGNVVILDIGNTFPIKNFIDYREMTDISTDGYFVVLQSNVIKVKSMYKEVTTSV